MASRRLPREKATSHLVALLERICAGGRYADCVTEVHVFGSYARGAVTVGDVDVDIEYDTNLDEEVHQEVVHRVVSGRDWNAPFRKALRPPTRAVQMLFNYAASLEDGTLIYRRGDTLEAALERLGAIRADADAGRAERDAMLSALEPVADDLTRPSRILLTELAARGLVSVELIDLPDADLDDLPDGPYAESLRFRYTSSSPLARAASAAGAHLHRRGADLAHVHLLGQDVKHDDTPWVVECREQKLSLLVRQMGHFAVSEWLFVLRPNLKRPLRALRITAADQSALAEIGDVDVWLAEHAPHISRIG